MLAETPQNGGYMVAAYVVTTVILGGYWVRLYLKQRKRELPKASAGTPTA
jgi:hypothetical protein